MSHCTHCACRDCFARVIASNDPTEGPALCDACQDADCDAGGLDDCQARDDSPLHPMLDDGYDSNYEDDPC